MTVKTWEVQSDSGSGTYNVTRDDDGNWSCQCGDYRWRNRECKHIERQQEKLTDETVVKYRPKFAVGDRVEVNNPDFNKHGKQGVVKEVNPSSTWPYTVRVDGDFLDGAYYASELKLTEDRLVFEVDDRVVVSNPDDRQGSWYQKAITGKTGTVSDVTLGHDYPYHVQLDDDFGLIQFKSEELSAVSSETARGSQEQFVVGTSVYDDYLEALDEVERLLDEGGLFTVGRV